MAGTVSTDVGAALALAASGGDVVLVAPAAAAPRPGSGRLAVLIGDPSSEEDLAAARAMADELFGRPPASGIERRP